MSVKPWRGGQPTNAIGDRAAASLPLMPSTRCSGDIAALRSSPRGPCVRSMRSALASVGVWHVAWGAVSSPSPSGSGVAAFFGLFADGPLVKCRQVARKDRVFAVISDGSHITTLPRRDYERSRTAR